GIELNPREPAYAEITLPVLPATTDPFVPIPMRTQVAAEPASGNEPVVFETERAIFALTAELAAVVSLDGAGYTDSTGDNDDPGNLFYAFGAQPQKDSVLMLGFRFAGPFPQVELNLAFMLPEKAVNAVVSDCTLPESAAFPSAVLAWEYWNGSAW